MPWRFACWSLVLLASSSAHAADAEGRARAALEHLQLKEAQALASAGIKEGGHSATELAALYAIWARALAAMDRPDEAEPLFASALELSPVGLLAEDLPPKVLKPYRSAEARIGGERLRLIATSEPMSDGRIRSRLLVEHDRMGLVRELRLQPTGQPAQVGKVSSPLELVWSCAQPPCSYSAVALDAYQNALAQTGTLWVDAPPARADAAATAAQAPSAPSLWRRPTPYLVGAAAFALLGAGLATAFALNQSALEEVSAQRGQHTYAEAQRLDAARKGLRAGAFASAGVSAALGVTAVVLW